MILGRQQPWLTAIAIVEQLLEPFVCERFFTRFVFVVLAGCGQIVVLRVQIAVLSVVALQAVGGVCLLSVGHERQTNGQHGQK